MGDVNSKESSSATGADAEKNITPLSPQTLSRRESEKQKAARRSTILELSGRLLPNSVNNRNKLPPPSAYDSTDDEETNNNNKSIVNPEPKVIQQIKKEETPPNPPTPLPSPDEHNPTSPSPFLSHDQATHLQIRSSIENTLNLLNTKTRKDRHSILLEQSTKHMMKRAVYSRAEGERDFSAVEEQSLANPTTEENTSANSSFTSNNPIADLKRSDPNNSMFSMDNDDSTASTPVLTPIITPTSTPLITPQPSFEDVLSPLAAKHFNETNTQPILDVNLIDFGENNQPSQNFKQIEPPKMETNNQTEKATNDKPTQSEPTAPVAASTENQGGYLMDDTKDKLSQSAPDLNKAAKTPNARPPPSNIVQHAATLRNSEPTKKNATVVISGGYSSKSSDFLESRPRGRSNTTVAARTVSSPQSPPQVPLKGTSPPQSDAEEEEDEVIFLEALVNWRKLPTEDIVEYGLELSNQFPGLIKKMRDDLKGRVKKREDSQKPMNNAGNLDWNSHFQQLLEELQRCDDSFDRTKIYSQLTNLAQDFIHCAKTYGKLIISEVYLPVEEKTVKPTQMGGFAGGLKYVVKNILFKFALDQNGLYGSDMIAAKVAGHDLRGLIQYFNLGIPDLHFPLMALVDYMGFRLQALSLLPINSSTIIYGTPDGGRTIFDNDPKFNMKMKLAAQKLNLKTHAVGLKKGEGKVLYSCADMEGHDGLDGRFYLLDFARVMPPLDVDNASHFKNAHLFRLFRPEFVKKYTIPLCSDTFSGFVANHNPQEHIREIQEATKYLHTKVIPQVVAELNAVQSEEELMQLSIKAALHKKGVNLCMMGLLRQYVTNTGVKKKLLREMIARVAKHQMNERLRAKMKELKLALQEPYKDVVIDYLNILFGTSEQSKTYWNQHLKRHILSNFPFGLSIEESDVEYDLKGNYVATNSLCLLFRSVKKMSGLKFTSISSKEFSKNPQSFAFKTPFDDTDLDELGEKVKHLNIMAASMGYYLTDKALVKTGANARRLFCLAIERFQEALESNPEDKTTLRELAKVQAVLQETNLAKKYYKEAIDADPSDPITHFRYAVFLEEIGEVDQAEEHFFKSLECDPDDHHTLFQYADFLFRRGKVEESEKFYELARRHSTMTSVAEEEIYENERKSPNSNDFSKEYLLISDYRGAWSTRRGTPIRKEDIRLPSNWEWVGDWTVDKSKRPCDPEGWQYAVAWRSDWVPYRFNGALVRRRRWKRSRKNKLTNDDLPDIKIEELVMRLRDPVHGIPLRDRKHFLRTYEDCFTGTEAVQWMVQTYGISVPEAIKLGNKLIELKYIHHVTYEHVFADAYLFYQFTNQEETQVKFMRHMSKTESRAKDFNSIKKQGFLEKQGFIVQSWKKRWFVLKKGSLYYYKRPQDGSPKGIISLVQTSVVPYSNVSGHQTHADPQLLFTIKTGVRNFHLKASTPTERDDWVKAISANCIT